jgi:hypothetical protein
MTRHDWAHEKHGNQDTMTDKATFKVEIKSPFGRQPIEQFYHYLSKVADESKERWNIEVTIERIEE